MSNLVFPTLAGRDIKVKRTPLWSTEVLTTESGKEMRAAWWSYPRYRYTMAFNFLRKDVNGDEFAALEGFFHRHRGQMDSFLFTDPEDNSVTGMPFGVGDGSKNAFQLQRTAVPSAALPAAASRAYWPASGDGYEPITELNGTPVLYRNGAPMTAGVDYVLGSNGAVTIYGNTITAANESFGPGNGSSTGFTLKIGGSNLAGGTNPTVTAIRLASNWDGANLAYVWPRKNQFLWAEDLTNGAWNVMNASKASATKLNETATNSSHSVFQAGATGGYKTIQGEFKAGERNWVVLFHQSLAIQAFFDLTNGVVGTVTGTEATASITPVPGDPGWYKCVFTALAPSGNNEGFGIASADNTPQYLGTAGYGLYARKVMWDHADKNYGYLFSDSTNGTASDTTSNPAWVLLKTSARTQILQNAILAGSGSTPSANWTKAGTATTTLGASTYTGDSAQAITIDASAAAGQTYFGQTPTALANTTYCFSILVENVNITSALQYARSLIVAYPPSGSLIYPPCPANPFGGPTSNKTLQAGVLKIIIKVGATGGPMTVRAGFGIGDNFQGTIKFSRPQLEVGTERTAFMPSNVNVTYTITDYAQSDVAVTFSPAPANGATLNWDGFYTSGAPTAGTVFSWDGAYYRRCRFDQDESEFEREFSRVWNGKTIKLVSVK